MASIPQPAKTVLQAIGRAITTVGPFVFGALSAIPFCAAGVLVLNTVTVTYGPLVALRAAAIAAEYVVIIPFFVWLGCWLCGRDDAKKRRARLRAYRAGFRATSSSSPARHRKVA